MEANRHDELNKRRQYQLKVNSLQKEHKRKSVELFAKIRATKPNPEPLVHQAACLLNERYETKLKELREEESSMKVTFDRQQNVLRSHHDKRQFETSEMLNEVSLLRLTFHYRLLKV